MPAEVEERDTSLLTEWACCPKLTRVHHNLVGATAHVRGERTVAVPALELLIGVLPQMLGKGQLRGKLALAVAALQDLLVSRRVVTCHVSLHAADVLEADPADVALIRPLAATASLGPVDTLGPLMVLLLVESKRLGSLVALLANATLVGTLARVAKHVALQIALSLKVLLALWAKEAPVSLMGKDVLLELLLNEEDARAILAAQLLLEVAAGMVGGHLEAKDEAPVTHLASEGKGARVAVHMTPDGPLTVAAEITLLTLIVSDPPQAR